MLLAGTIVSKQKNGPIFVVGTPRSGTTLTGRILGKHSKIYMPGETPFFHDIYSRRSQLGELTTEAARRKVADQLLSLHSRYNSPGMHQLVEKIFSDKALLHQLYTDCDSYEAMFSFFMAQLAGSEGKTRWGNNVPNDIFYIDEIMSLYPNAIILICVRDIRDFLVSYKEKWRRSPGANAERVKNLYHPLLTTLLWKSSMRRLPEVLSKVPEGNAMLVKYEDLTTNPQEILQTICQTLGEEFESDMMNIETNNSSTLTQQRGIFASSVGRWKTSLDPAEAMIAQWFARRELLDLGYGIEQLPIRLGKVAAILVSFPFAAVRAVLANKGRRASLVPYLFSRLRSLFVSQRSAR